MVALLLCNKMQKLCSFSKSRQKLRLPNVKGPMTYKNVLTYICAYLYAAPMSRGPETVRGQKTKLKRLGCTLFCV